MLIALYYFIQYSRSSSIQDALKWQLSLSAAILFRIEGIAFLALAPFALLFIEETRKRIVGHIFKLNVLFICVAAAVVLASWLLGLFAAGDIPLQERIGRVNQLGYASPLTLIGAVNTEAETMYARNRFMSSVGDARLILASGVFTLVLAEVISNSGLPFLAVWGYGAFRKWLRLSRESRIVAYFAAVSLLTLVPVAMRFFFLSSRQTVLIVLMISLISFQYVDYLLQKLSRRKQIKWAIAAWVLILALFLDGVISTGASKRIIRDAGEWLQAEVEIGGRIACNEARLQFYSQDKCEWVVFGGSNPTDAIVDLKEKGYGFLLLWIDRKNQPLRLALDTTAGLQLKREFRNKAGSRVRFYRVEP
jgi:hypothetical protein